ncbi:trypsin-like peptidase domain-containing protein [Flavobacterium haoranii]|uniref:Do/DeqQ family serine protease n=1 Tax=Flavobacterium haoranii TaxID=683124 RepID=A0A1M6BJL6_9FLAO|nr:trypsin-like peptidase domain-containing protein [Flavobacterium haoranii]SHI48904.1 Do/DeqQ family serine protease [Flavobacterium haoranii]
MKRLGSLLLVSLLSGAITLGAYKLFLEPKSNTITTVAPTFSKNVSLGAENIDFTAAADMAVHSVVHVKNVSVRKVYNPIMEFIYGSRGGGMQQEQVGTGSGVIISEDGYIATNNHVIQDATQLEVTLNNNKTYKAKLVGTDSKMDIALLKIDADEKLPYMVFGDSEAIKVGEWVLAVGNPYNLNSTVTAGIVSAKARDLSNSGLQSFIQTDAAVNPGNSGGALVNTRGELIGINTMISSPTGSYAGYSFAVPSNITRKIIEDLMQFGNVQRGILGVEGSELNSAVADNLGVSQTQGFYVAGVTKKSGAEKAGIKEGDIIIKLDDKKVNSFSDLTSYINTKRPDDVINVTVIRDENEKIIPVKLSKKELLVYEANGIEFEDITNNDKQKFNVDYGIKIKSVTNDEYKGYANELEGAIILSIDGKRTSNAQSAAEYIKSKGNQKSQYQLITSNGEIMRAIL